jgi:hypothetical protein
MSAVGRPPLTDDDYRKFLDEMYPFLRAGNTLYYSLDKAGLINHQTAIYDKYRLNDWFAQKVDAWRATIGVLANNIVFKKLEHLQTRIVETDGKHELTRDETEVLKLVAEKHRTAQPFFVTRVENAVVDESTVGKVLDKLETKTNYDELGSEIAKQSVETDAPVQNQN